MLLMQLTVTHARNLDRATKGAFYEGLSVVAKKGFDPVILGQRVRDGGGSGSRWFLVVGFIAADELVIERTLPIPANDIAAMASIVQLHLIDYIDELKAELVDTFKAEAVGDGLDELLPFPRSKVAPS